MKIEEMQIGTKVKVCKSNQATFQAYGYCKVKNNYNTWVDDPIKPWYPHGEIGEIYKVSDCYCYVKTSDGKEWKYPIGFWALEKE